MHTAGVGDMVVELISICRKPYNLLFVYKTSVENNMNKETFLERGMRQIRCHFWS